MTRPVSIARIIVIVAVLWGANLGIARASRSAAVPPRQALSLFPTRIDAWTGASNVPFESKVMRVLKLDDFLNREYHDRAGHPIWLYVGYYAAQRTGETAHSPLNCLPGNGWEPIKIGTVDILVSGPAGPRTIRISRYVVQKGVERQVVLFWYQSHGRVMWNEYETKLRLMTDAIFMHRTDGAIVRVIAPLDRTEADDAQTEARALEFVERAFPHFDDYLPN